MNEDEFHRRLAKAVEERNQAMRDYLAACDQRDEARAQRAFLKNNYSPEAAAALRAELASARAEIEALKFPRACIPPGDERATALSALMISQAETEIRSLKAEVERLRALLPPSAHTGVRNGPGEGSWAVFAEKVVEERDEARAEVARLTKERDAARKSFEEAIESLEESEHEMHLRVRAGYDKTVADSWRAKVAEIERERDEARRNLGEILAVIHRDGGHHTGEFGVSQSVADAHATWAAVVRERDEALSDAERWRNAHHEACVRLQAHDCGEEYAILGADAERWRNAHDTMREMIKRLLLSRDASWTGGHDWSVAVDDAIELLGMEPERQE